MSKVLIVAFHYPPVGESSGVHRTLKFSQHLPLNGWHPLILTVNPRAYGRVNDDQLNDIPESVEVTRAFAIDAAKQLSIAGRYPSFLALPDRWVSWWLGGVFAGLKLIRKHRPEVIMSTYPIATAHLIGLTLHRLTGIPWVLDFRDSMVDDEYPTTPLKRRIFQWIERKSVLHSSKVIFTTPGAVRMYAERYPDIDSSRWAIIENGYDEEKFIEMERASASHGIEVKTNKKIILLHSGLLYPFERNPKDFFEAIKLLKETGDISGDTLNIKLRASGNEDQYGALLAELDIVDIVELAPPVSYGEALQEMLMVDGLLLFQGGTCNHQIPAKVYEYIRAKKPIFAMTDKNGDTASVLIAAGITSIVPLDVTSEITNGLKLFLLAMSENKSEIASQAAIEQHSRKHKSAELAKIIDAIKK